MGFKYLRRGLTPHKRITKDDSFPTKQLFVLALCRICEPIAFMSIFPYIYYMVKSFRITSEDKQIAIYAGMVTSAFALAEFLTGVLWGRLSDKVGRKPILLMGLAGTGFSMCVFGFARSLPVALIARALGGLLNGNIGVLQTTVAEVVTVQEHQPRAFAIMPFIWCLGSIIGSGLGGCLADPVQNYPGVFAPGGILEAYPFLLPNMVSALIVIFGLIVGILFLEETHEKRRKQRDYGLEVGNWLLRACKLSEDDDYRYEKLADAGMAEDATLVEDDEQPPDYLSNDSSPLLTGTLHDAKVEPPTESLDVEAASPPEPTNVKTAFTPQVIFNVFAYGILAYHTIGFEQLLPVLLSMDEPSRSPELPFKFTGGFGFASSTIGIILSLQGVYQMAAQMIIFPAVVHRFGPLKTFRFTAFVYPLLYFVTPYISLMPSALRIFGLFTVLVGKVTFQALSYPSNMLILTDAAPSLLVLGFVNGVAASAASLARAIGPTVAGLIQSAGLELGYLGLSWWASGAVAGIGAIQCLWIRYPNRRIDGPSGMRSSQSAENASNQNQGFGARSHQGESTNQGRR